MDDYNLNSIPDPVSNPKKLKNKEIPLLNDYSKKPQSKFWDNFPKVSLPDPDKPRTPLDADAYERLFIEHRDKLLQSTQIKVINTIKNLRHGADSLVDVEAVLPLYDVNSTSMYSKPQIGQFYTDQLATLMKGGYVSGPFEKPPFDDFRVNSLFVIEQSNKYRPILNLSSPCYSSFNDAIDDDLLDKVTMSSPVIVASKIKRIGTCCYFSKVDHSSAYKLIPCKHEHLWMQGFTWLDMFFVETSQIFGAISAVPNYDNFHLGFSAIVQKVSDHDAFYFERQLDDQIILARSFEECKKVTDVYLKFAELINLPLAEFAQNKAFANQQTGVILGVFFDAANQTWSIDESKHIKYKHLIGSIAKNKNSVTKKQLQQVLGVINNITQMAHTLKFFRAPIVADLKRAYNSDPQPIMLSDDCFTFLLKWLVILDDLQGGFPLPDFTIFPPVICKTYASDAAGGAFLKENPDLSVGVGMVGYVQPYGTRMENFTSAGQCLWPSDFILQFRDFSNRAFGNKTTLLECMGSLLPLYHNISELLNQPAVILVDNMAVVFAFKNGRSRLDIFTSLMVYVIQCVATTFNIKLFYQHVPRVSTLPALMADTLSRTDQKGVSLKDSLDIPLNTFWPPSLLSWMSKPTIDWSLALRVVADFREAAASGSHGFGL